VSREAIPTWFFVLVVVRDGDRFLVIHERKHGQRYYLPAGRVEPGESLVAAALRETQEESRVQIELDGVLQVQHTPMAGQGSRVRVIFVARPRADSPAPGSTDDSLDAAWVTLEQLDTLPLRGPEVARWFRAVASGATVYPLSLLGQE